MSRAAVERLREVRTFPQLVKYLREELAWPIEQDSFEDLTFDWDAIELGLDLKTTAKIKQIKQLRPLVGNQPFGIFFVEFRPGRLPVVALRRILSKVVLNKRQSAKSSERKAWAAEDLLFISAYGEGDSRQITFAHFRENADKPDLPTLKVLGWDNLDTALHLDEVARELSDHLVWPDDATNAEAWRTRWRDAFTLGHRQVITTSKELSSRLADLARAIRDRIKAALRIETERGPLTRLVKAFQTALVHDLDVDGFADMYAQTIAYGLLSARIADPHKKTADDFAAHMRTNPFLRELMETFLKVGGRRGKAGEPGIDFDELGVSEIVELLDDANMEAVVRDFGDKNPDHDPVIHFYEHFLAAYDRDQKVSRGVFYTPRPVVSYIVRSVDELLRTKFGLADGLADTTTWGQMAKRTMGPKVPEGVSPDQDFVQILDPATGTGTFLVEVIDFIHKTLVTKWKAQGYSQKHINGLWNDFVPKHLLTRLHGYELLMAPYAIAHLKIGLKLYETGYRFGSEERARVYLTNALEPAQDFSGRFAFAIPALAHEAQAVNTIKKRRRFTVVIGNPPYSNFGQLNKNPFIMRLLEDYKRGLNERKLNLDDDFIKFVRLAQWLVDATGAGVLGMITNGTFLDGVNHRKMREALIWSFPVSFLLNLHGNTKRKEKPPNGMANDNVFDIMQGVSISLLVRPKEPTPRDIYYYDAWGTRAEKYQLLSRSTWRIDGSVSLNPRPERFFLVAKDLDAHEYELWPSVTALFPLHSLGIETSRDGFAVAFDKAALVERIRKLCSSDSDEVIRREYGLEDKRDWTLAEARRALKTVGDPSSVIQRVRYRPFDERFIIYSDATVTWPRHEVLDNLLSSGNVALICIRNSREESTQNFYCTRDITDKAVISSRDNATVFPLYRHGSGESTSLFGVSEPGFSPNLSVDLLRKLGVRLGRSETGEQPPSHFTPEDIFHYAYAVFHSPGYRTRYGEFLKIDFPRLPVTGEPALLRSLARIGGELVALHILESPKLGRPIAEYVGGRGPEPEKVSWSRNTVWVDKAKTAGFKGVREEVWNFHIGGYQVCEKWLKDRKGRKLSKDDITHYRKIVVALSETIRLMKEIDDVIEQYGGWPGAFQTEKPKAYSEQEAVPVRKVAEKQTSPTARRKK